MTQNHFLELKLRNFDEKARSFEGFAAVYGNVDSYGDVIQPGAFTKTIQERPEVPILWQHDPGSPVGVGRLEDSAQGLKIAARLVDGIQRAEEAYTFLKAGVVSGLSIGYWVIKSDRERDVRHLRELKVLEVSLATIPANDLARITAVKFQALPNHGAATSTVEPREHSAILEQLRKAQEILRVPR